MDSADPRRRRRAREAAHDPDQAWRWARERERLGPPEGLEAHLHVAAADDAALRGWWEGFAAFGSAWLLRALSAAVQGCWEALGEGDWAPADAAEAAWACAGDPSPSRRAEARTQADEADACAERCAGDAALVAAAAARLARLAASHDPEGSPKPWIQQGLLVVRALRASGVEPADLQARVQAGLSVNGR